MKKRALLSVSDKTGIVEFARRVEALGYEIVSTGGTSTALEGAGIRVINVSEITGFPECLDGRLKTLHPVVHGGILAMRSNPEHMAQIEMLGIEPIDIVAINLYPFKQTILREGVLLEEAIEKIDIGGPAMIRSAAKNWQDVTVLVDPADYEEALAELEGGGMSQQTRFRLATKVFEHTAHYDALIAEYLRRENGGGFPSALTMTYEKVQDMRYGENPHQSAAYYREVGGIEGTMSMAEQLHGKDLSFLNIADADSAVRIVKEFERPCAAAIKHMTPCGVGVADTIAEAYLRAYECDPVSIFGGIIALNRQCDEATANEISKLFIDVLVAPSYTDEALEILTRKKNIRILSLDEIAKPINPRSLDVRKTLGGLLVQTPNDKVFGGEGIKTVTEREATPAELASLEFAWKVVKHVRSNAIVLANGDRIVGIGCGQVNRVGALEHAIKQAGDAVKGAVMASDALIPMPDCVEISAAVGITAIIQTGGSIRDQDSIDACDKSGLAMLFTGMRHFRH